MPEGPGNLVRQVLESFWGIDEFRIDPGFVVGVGAAILGPVHIGSNAIVGANSVVTRDVPENVIVSGLPAHVIKERWDEESGRTL